MALGKLPDNPNLGKDGKDWQSIYITAEGEQEIPRHKIDTKTYIDIKQQKTSTKSHQIFTKHCKSIKLAKTCKNNQKHS